MLELLLFTGLLVAFTALAAGVLKFIVFVVLLPIKLALLVFKGVVGLVLVLPAIALSGLVVLNIIPLLLAIVLLPVILIVGGLWALARAAF